MSKNLNSWKSRTLLFLVSQAVTLFGSSIVQFVIVWHVTKTTSSGAWVSALTVCSFVPQFLISFVSGVWADRYNKKMLIILSDSVIAVATIALALLIPSLEEVGDTSLLIALIVTSVIRSVGAGVQLPAVNAVIPQLVPESHLMRINGINATVQSVVQFAAPAVAGALLTFFDMRSALFIDIATAAVGIGLLSCIALPKQKSSEEKTSAFSDMVQGVKYAKSNSFIGKLLINYGLFVFLAVPAGFLATLFVSRTYGDSYFYMSVVEIIGFAGMAAGGLLMSIWGGFSSRVKTLNVGLIAFGVLGICMGAVINFYVYLAMMLIYGIALTMVQTAVTTLIQENVDGNMQGRVFGFLGAMYSGFLPIGMAVFGPLADFVSLRLLMIIAGIVLMILPLAIRLKNPISANREAENG